MTSSKILAMYSPATLIASTFSDPKKTIKMMSVAKPLGAKFGKKQLGQQLSQDHQNEMAHKMMAELLMISSGT